MNRFNPFVLAVLAAAVLSACASNQRQSRVVASNATGQQCPISHEGIFLGNWKQVRSEGFTFCVPTNWGIDARIQRGQGSRQASIYRLLSYTSPDSNQHVTFEVPSGGTSLGLLKTSIARCDYESPGGLSRIAEQQVCITYGNITSSTRTTSANGAPSTSAALNGSASNSTRPRIDALRPESRAANAQTVTYSAPYIRGTAVGVTEAWVVLQTVRPSDQTVRP